MQAFNIKVTTLLLTAALLSSCSHVQGFIATGETLNSAAEVFLATDASMQANHEVGGLSEADYAKWEAFGKKFQAVFITCHKLYKIAVLTNDTILEGKALAAAAVLIPELIAFAQSVKVSVEILKQ